MRKSANVLIFSTCILFFILGIYGCGSISFGYRGFCDIPYKDWSKMSEDQKYAAVREYFSDKAILIFQLTKDGPLEAYGNVYLKFSKKKYPGEPLQMSVFITSSPNKLGKELVRLSRSGFYFWEIRPGANSFRVWPEGKYVSGIEKFPIDFDAQAGTIINLGKIVLLSSDKSSYPKKRAAFAEFQVRPPYALAYYSWDCIRSYSAAPIDSFAKIFPEVYEVFKNDIINP